MVEDKRRIRKISHASRKILFFLWNTYAHRNDGRVATMKQMKSFYDTINLINK